ncbi:hypothetical protein MTO96_014737 [Rhipicephalus appendiculatus]
MPPSLFILLFVQVLQVLAKPSSYPEISASLQNYQDLSTCTLDKTVWNLVYRNYYDDAHFGSVKCATFRDLRNFKDYFTSIRSDKNGTFNSSEKIVLKSSPGYTAKNLIQSKSDGKNGTVEVNVIYTDCQKCIVLRHPYANDGYGCTYWRRYDTIKEQTDGCEFIYDELCGTVPKYRTCTSTCTPKTFVIVPDLPSKPWDWSLLKQTAQVPERSAAVAQVTLSVKHWEAPDRADDIAVTAAHLIARWPYTYVCYIISNIQI